MSASAERAVLKQFRRGLSTARRGSHECVVDTDDWWSKAASVHEASGFHAACRQAFLKAAHVRKAPQVAENTKTISRLWWWCQANCWENQVV